MTPVKVVYDRSVLYTGVRNIDSGHHCSVYTKIKIRTVLITQFHNAQCVSHERDKSEAKFLVTEWGDIESSISPSLGLRIWSLEDGFRLPVSSNSLLRLGLFISRDLAILGKSSFGIWPFSFFSHLPEFGLSR
jgi:hypothetical protein